MSIRYTDVHVIVDTHKGPENEDRRRDLVQRLKRAILALHTKEGYKAVVPIVYPAEVSDEILNVNMKSAGIEKGTHRGTIHAHFVLEIEHNGRVELGRRRAPGGIGFNRRLQRFFSRHTGIAGCFAKAKLVETSRPKNYATKGNARRLAAIVATSGAERPDSPGDAAADQQDGGESSGSGSQ